MAQIHPGGLTRVQFYDGQSFVATNSGECSMFDDIGWGLNTALNGGYHAHAGYTTGSLASVDGSYQKLVTSDQNGGGTVITARYAYGDGNVVVSGSTDGAGFNWGGFTWGGVKHSIFHYLYGMSNVAPAQPGILWEDNGHYYESVPVAGGITWPQANDAANAMSYDNDEGHWYAHLVTVTSADENQFIVDNFTAAIAGIYWIGGHQTAHDNEPAGGWSWVTGEAWSYTNWAASEPNNMNGNESFLHFWNANAGWNDLGNQGLGGFVVEWELQDPSAPEITLSSSALNFGDVLVGTDSDLTLSISNEGDADLNVSNVSVAGSGFSTDFGGAFTVAPGGSYDVTVTFSPNATGNYSGSVTVSSDDEDEASLNVSLTGTGVAPEIAVAPTSLAFGEVALFGEAQLTFDVTNEGSANLNVSGMNVSGGDFAVDFGGAFALSAGSSQTFTVTYSADTYGAVTGSIDILSDDADESVVTVSLSGTAIAPIITVDPASLDFGTNEFRRDVADLTFDVCNEGNTGGTVNDVVVTGANFSSDFGGSFDLAPGECQTITVSFEALVVGAANGSVAVESNDPVNGTANVTLAANVVWVPSATLLDRLCERVHALQAGGFLNRGQANSLCVKTDNAERHLLRNQPRQAISMLTAFRNEVASFISTGVLSAANGQPLITEANFIASLIAEFGTAAGNGSEAKAAVIPTELVLNAGYPNPFNATSIVRFGMPEAGRVEMSLFDMTGREVSRLVSGTVQAGYHSITIDGNSLRAGMYIVRLSALGETQTSGITYIK